MYIFCTKYKKTFFFPNNYKIHYYLKYILIFSLKKVSYAHQSHIYLFIQKYKNSNIIKYYYNLIELGPF